MPTKTSRQTPTKPACGTSHAAANRPVRGVKAKLDEQLSLFDYAASMGISLLPDAS